MRLVHSRSDRWRGVGYLAGSTPVGEDDGRAKIINVPSRVRIQVRERRTMLCVWSGLSKTDGTWHAGYLSPDFRYVVIGFDDRGLVNSAIQDWLTPYVEP